MSIGMGAASEVLALTCIISSLSIEDDCREQR